MNLRVEAGNRAKRRRRTAILGVVVALPVVSVGLWTANRIDDSDQVETIRAATDQSAEAEPSTAPALAETTAEASEILPESTALPEPTETPNEPTVCGGAFSSTMVESEGTGSKPPIVVAEEGLIAHHPDLVDWDLNRVDEPDSPYATFRATDADGSLVAIVYLAPRADGWVLSEIIRCAA